MPPRRHLPVCLRLRSRTFSPKLQYHRDANEPKSETKIVMDTRFFPVPYITATLMFSATKLESSVMKASIICKEAGKPESSVVRTGGPIIDQWMENLSPIFGCKICCYYG
jgi:hypothetical protein